MTKNKERQAKFYDAYEVGLGTVQGGRHDGMESCCITFRNRNGRTRTSVGMPKQMAIDLARDILEMDEDP
jgi:hypothetical protein